MMENLVVAKIKAGWNWQGKHSPLFSEMFKVKNSAERSNLPNELYIFQKPMKEVCSLNTCKPNLSVVSLSLSLHKPIQWIPMTMTPDLWPFQVKWRSHHVCGEKDHKGFAWQWGSSAVSSFGGV